MPAAKSSLQKVLELAGQFVSAQKGDWCHEDWEGFLAKVAKAGISLNDESKRNLGNILEGLKFFYHMMAAPAKKAPAGKKKTVL